MRRAEHRRHAERARGDARGGRPRDRVLLDRLGLWRGRRDPDPGGRALPRPDARSTRRRRSPPRGCSRRTRSGFGFRTWIFRFVSLLGPALHARPRHRLLAQARDAIRRASRSSATASRRRATSTSATASPRCSPRSSALASPSTSSTSATTDAIEVNDSIGIITRRWASPPRLEYAGGERGWVGDSPANPARYDAHPRARLGADEDIEESVVETLRFLMANPHAERRDRQRP